jgi:hypothetical protein
MAREWIGRRSTAPLTLESEPLERPSPKWLILLSQERHRAKRWTSKRWVSDRAPMFIAIIQASRTNSQCIFTVQAMTTTTKVPTWWYSGKSLKATQAPAQCLAMILKVFSWSKAKVWCQPSRITTRLARWVPSMWTQRAKEEYTTTNNTPPPTMCYHSRITTTEWSQITPQTLIMLTSSTLWARITILLRPHLAETKSLTRRTTQF